MNNNKLFQDAIADAKAVREAALANAKAVLEETFTPRLQSMLSAKLNEMEDDENQEMEEGYEPSNEDESFDISEILAELDNEELEEAKKDDKEEEKEEDETEAEDDETKEEEETEEEAVEVKDMTVDELTSLIKDIVSQEMNTGEESMGDEMGDMGDMGDMSNVGGETEDNLDMDSIETSEENDEELDLEELLAELDALDNDVPENTEDYKSQPGYVHETKSKKDNKELKEAVNTIQILRKELNEVNLLNSKLLYVNKIFKSKNLSESQKIHVISSFDKAKTTKEAKLVYESLIVNLQPKKQAIKESIGFASKATGIAPKKQIIESSDIVTRMQRLANIIK